VSIVLHNHVKEGHLAQYQTRAEDEIFNEQLHPLSLDKIDFKKVGWRVLELWQADGCSVAKQCLSLFQSC
jgi:hypothetical protein